LPAALSSPLMFRGLFDLMRPSPLVQMWFSASRFAADPGNQAELASALSSRPNVRGIGF
jgi:hypothetical protein